MVKKQYLIGIVAVLMALLSAFSAQAAPASPKKDTPKGNLGTGSGIIPNMGGKSNAALPNISQAPGGSNDMLSTLLWNMLMPGNRQIPLGSDQNSGIAAKSTPQANKIISDFFDKMRNDTEFRNEVVDVLKNEPQIRNMVFSNIRDTGSSGKEFADNFLNDDQYRKNFLDKFQTDDQYRSTVLNSVESWYLGPDTNQ